MQINGTEHLATETARVHEAYAKRTEEHIRLRYVWSSEGHQFSHQERERQSLALLRQHGYMPLAGRTILEVGCGSGAWIQQFIRWGASPDHLTAIDLRADVLARARANLPAAVTLEQANAAAIPFASGQFDIVLQSTMFTSVLDEGIRRQIAGEMLRVLKPDGVILWYDFLVNNPANPDVRRVGKREINSLFSGCKLDLRRVTLVPPVLRWLAPRSWFLTYMLSHVRPFCTHYLGVITRRSTHA